MAIGFALAVGRGGGQSSAREWVGVCGGVAAVVHCHRIVKE